MKYSKYIPLISLLGDFLILNALFVVGYIIMQPKAEHFSDKHLLFYIYLNACWIVLFFVFGAHNVDRNTKKKSIFFTYVRIIVFYFFFFLMYFQAVPLQYYPRHHLKYLFALFFFSLILWKFVLYYAFYFYRKYGYNYRNVIILGYGNKAKELAKYFLTNPWHGYRFLGFIDKEVNLKRRIMGSWDDLKSFIEANDINQVYISWDTIPRSVLDDVSNLLADYPIKIRILPDLENFAYKSAELVNYGMVPVLQIHPGPLSFWYNRLLKRSFDIVVSLIVIIGILSWFSLILYILDLIFYRQGIFFNQERTCIDGKVFICHKFRSMQRNDESDDVQATRNDKRVTRVGRFLRKWSLDEMPQFVNVLKGEMSIVGPRPHMIKHTEEYQKLVKRFMLRHTVSPGITGLAQVNGYRGEIKEPRDIIKRVELDAKYIENWSFNMDIKIILMTMWVIIKGQDTAY
ncbi:MAG TPA: exopolysaccharide biosynthesis polyprenyl glycosylphosphotransferase [Tenuifilaceae bacterium]|nr:exopolysaccharide biosynthesis polyprenyl glycosylphosphotransferase [Tenuifilaceae bacterium]